MNSVKLIKTANQVNSQVQSMLKHFENYHFVTRSNEGILKLNFNAENLKQIIKNEWLVSNSIFCDQPAFTFPCLNSISLFKSAFSNVKSMVSAVPFSLIELNTNHLNNKSKIRLPANDVELVKNQFENGDSTILKNHTICKPEKGIEIFYKMQREHKLWWRKVLLQYFNFFIMLIINKNIFFSFQLCQEDLAHLKYVVTNLIILNLLLSKLNFLGEQKLLKLLNIYQIP